MELNPFQAAWLTMESLQIYMGERMDSSNTASTWLCFWLKQQDGRDKFFEQGIWEKNPMPNDSLTFLWF